MNSTGEGAVNTMDMGHDHHGMGMEATSYDIAENCCGETSCPMLSCVSSAIFSGPSVAFPASHAGVQPDLLRTFYYPPELKSLYRPPISR